MCDQLNPARLLTNRGTVWKVKSRVSGENGQISRGMGLKYSMYKLVIFLELDGNYSRPT